MIKIILAAMLALFAAVAFAAVDVNRATQAELESVKGIGPSISGKILDERKKAPFKDWQDMVDRVKGIGETNAAKFSTEGLTVNGSAFAGAPAKAPAPAAKADEKKAAAPAVAPAPAVAAAPAVKADAKATAAPAMKADAKVDTKAAAAAPASKAETKAAMAASAPADKKAATLSADDKKAAAAKEKEEGCQGCRRRRGQEGQGRQGRRHEGREGRCQEGQHEGRCSTRFGRRKRPGQEIDLLCPDASQCGAPLSNAPRTRGAFSFQAAAAGGAQPKKRSTSSRLASVSRTPSAISSRVYGASNSR